MQQASAHFHMSNNFSNSELFVFDISHNQVNQLFHKYFITWVVRYLCNVQLLDPLEILNVLLSVSTHILNQ